MTPVYLFLPIITVFYFAIFSAQRAQSGETDAAGILKPQFEGHPLSVILRFVLKLSLALVFFVGLAQLFSGNALLAPVAFASIVFTYIALRPLCGQQVASIATPLITLSWLLTRNWLALDLAAMLICAGTLVAFRNITLRMVVMVFTSIMLFDVINVYGTGLVTQLALPAGAGGSITAAPLLIQIPKVFGLANSPMAAALGNGDIVVPGLLLMYLAKQGKSKALGCATLFCYFGLVLSTYVATHYGPQPATLFLCPATALGALIGHQLDAATLWLAQDE